MPWPGREVTARLAGSGTAVCRRIAMSAEVPVTVRRERGVAIVEISGEIDMSTAAGLRERLFELADSGEPLIVDLNRITFIDSSGLGALVAVTRRAAGCGGSLHAVCSQPHTRRLLWLTGLERRIPLTATVDGALMQLTESRDAGHDRD
jgi:anti-anti-sigma factor